MYHLANPEGVKGSSMVVHAGPTPFGTLLRQLRTDAKLTRRELAARSGVSPRTITDLERGISRRPTLDTLRRLVDALDLVGDVRASFEAAARGRTVGVAASGEDTEGAIPTTLPTPVAPFIGRAPELAAVSGLLQRPPVRLLTLTGAGGTGKTRIAIEAAGTARPRFPGGVYFVPLASLADPHLLLPTLASALGIRETAGEPLQETLVRWLRPKQVLLVLDNLEHLAAAGPMVIALLEACPTLTVLVTSRVVLHLSGEYLFPVPPMSVPPDEDNIEPAALEDYDATALFVERARAVSPDFAVTPDTAPAIVAICTRLDGLPLAIELAAAQSRLFAPGQLLARFSGGLAALGEGPRDAPARQHSLRDTIDWSYRLLSPDDQRLFARLSIFAGGCTMDAAESVCGGDVDVRAGIERLLDSTLVGREPVDEPRITLLETIREYAAEGLQEAGEQEEIQRRHAETYRRLGDDALPALQGARQAEWLARLEIELDNLRAALGWLGEHHPPAALVLAYDLGQFWYVHGHWEEGVRWLEAALTRAGAAPSVDRGRALRICGWLQFHRGNQARAIELLEESAVLLREGRDEAELSTAFYDLGYIHMERGELDEAQTRYEQSLEHSQGQGGIGQRSTTLGSYSALARMRGEYGNAIELAEESLDLARQSEAALRVMYAWAHVGCAALSAGPGHHDRADVGLQEALALGRQMGAPNMVGTCLMNLGELAWERGDLERAQSYFEQGASVQRQIGNVHGHIFALYNLGKILLSQGDLSDASERLREGLQLVRETAGKSVLTGDFLSLCAQALNAAGRAEPAVVLWAASRRIQAESDYTTPASERRVEEQSMAQARAVLDEAAWEEAWEAGDAMTLEDAIEFALARTEIELPPVRAGDA